MKAAQLKIVSLIQAELNAAIATKNAASEGTDEQRFYAACDRVDSLEWELRLAMQGKRPAVDSITAQLVAANID